MLLIHSDGSASYENHSKLKLDQINTIELNTVWKRPFLKQCDWMDVNSGAHIITLKRILLAKIDMSQKMHDHFP